MVRSRRLGLLHRGLGGVVLLAQVATLLPVLLDGAVQLLRAEGFATDGAERLALRFGEGCLAILQLLGAGAIAAGLVRAFGLEALRLRGGAALAFDVGVELGEAGALPVETRFLLLQGRERREQYCRALALVVEAGDAGFEAGSLLGDGPLGSGDGVFDLAGLRCERGEDAFVVAGGAELFVVALDLRGVAERLVDGGKVGFEGGDGLGAALHCLASRFEQGCRLADGTFATLVLGGRDLQLAKLLLLGRELCANGLSLSRDLRELGFDGG